MLYMQDSYKIEKVKKQLSILTLKRYSSFLKKNYVIYLYI